MFFPKQCLDEDGMVYIKEDKHLLPNRNCDKRVYFGPLSTNLANLFHCMGCYLEAGPVRPHIASQHGLRLYLTDGLTTRYKLGKVKAASYTGYLSDGVRENLQMMGRASSKPIKVKQESSVDDMLDALTEQFPVRRDEPMVGNQTLSEYLFG